MNAATRSRFITPAAALLLLAGAIFLGLRTTCDLFDADELQHSHIAWLVAGGKVIYRDFWDNHGPLYALMNGALLAFSRAPPDISLLFWCRYASALATCGIAGLTFLIARILGLARPVALTAAGCFASLVFVQDKGAECRPDTWQNLFWFAGVATLLGAGPLYRARRSVTAGALMGLAIMTNVKAGLGPFVLALFYALGGRLHGLAPRAVGQVLAGLVAGGLFAYLPFVAYFFRHDALAEMHDYSVWWNFLYVDGGSAAGLSRANAGFLLTWQLPFVLLAGWGALAWIHDLRSPTGVLVRPQAWMLLALAAGTGLSLAMDFYYQFFLIFLPAWSIIAAFGLLRLGELLVEHRGGPGRVAAAAVALAAAGYMLTAAARLTPTQERPELQFQKSFTRMMLQSVPRTEPIAVIWDICGGFMFNEPLQYYWGAESAIGLTAERHSGINPFGEPFTAALEQRRVRFVVGRDDFLLRNLPEATQRFLHEKYRYSNCLWTRRREALP